MYTFAMDSNQLAPCGLDQIEFLFIGGNLALDFVNTRRSRRLVGSRDSIQFDQLWDAAQLDLWWKAVCGQYHFEPARYKWRESASDFVGPLRAELRSVFEWIASQNDSHVTRLTGLPENPPLLPLLNQVLSDGCFAVRRDISGQFTREYQSRTFLETNADDPLVAIAVAASDLLAGGHTDRIRACRSERCTLLFYDSTKSATRHWCQQGCMNRARARANYRKSKAEN